MSDNGQQVPLPGCMIGPSEPCDAFQRQTARIAELEAELERERVRVAACGVVAMANTRDSAREARQVLPEYRSALLCDVERAVDREMAERERREAAEGILRNIRNRGVGGWVTSAIDDHFARYEKEPT